MKKYLSLALVLTLLMGLVACKSDQKKEEKDLIVFAAASLTESLEEIKTLYEEENPGVNIIYTFDSSGTLKTQIEEGAPADVFISAAQKQINALDPEKNEDAKDRTIDPKTRLDLLENKVCLVLPKNSTKNIKTFEDLGSEEVKSIALGNSDVPVGQYSEEILKNLGIWDQIQEKITFGSNVKEVTTWVSEGVVDCGIIYKTDAYSQGLDVVYEEDGTHLETPVIYPGAVLTNSKNKIEAQKFLAYLQGQKAMEAFERVGFSPVK